MGGLTEHWMGPLKIRKMCFCFLILVLFCTTEERALIVCQKNSYLSQIRVCLGRYGVWAGLHAELFMTALVDVVTGLMGNAVCAGC